MEESLQYIVALQYLFEVHKSSVDEQNNSRSYINCHLFLPRDAQSEKKKKNKKPLNFDVILVNCLTWKH